MLPKRAPPVGTNPIGMAVHRPTSKALMHSARCASVSLFVFSCKMVPMHQAGIVTSVARHLRHSSISSLAGCMHDDNRSGGHQQDVALAVGANLVSSDTSR